MPDEKLKQPETDESEARQMSQFDQLEGASAETGSQEGEWIPGDDLNKNDQAESISPSGQQLAEMATDIIFGMLQNMRGPHWKLSEDERTQMVDNGGRCIDYYFDDVEMTPATALVVTGAMIALPRLAMDMAAKKETEKAKPKPDDKKSESFGFEAEEE